MKTVQHRFFCAVENNKMDMLDLLLKYGANANAVDTFSGRSALHVAVSKKNVQMVEKLIQHGANVATRDNSGEGPLNTVLGKKSEEAAKICQILREHGAVEYRLYGESLSRMNY